MPKIELSQSTIERLKRHAEPFVDTPESVIPRALEALESQIRGDEGIPPSDADIIVDPRNIPNLTHTKLLSARIEGKNVVRPNWNSLLDQMLIIGRKRGLTANDIRRVASVNVKEGEKTDEGYSYLKEVNLSVQGQDSNAACRGIVAMARHLQLHVELEFMWRAKDGAAHPGKVASLEIN